MVNAIWTCCVWGEETGRHRGASVALQKAVIEAHFAFQVLNWRPWMAPHFVLKPFAKWTVDWADGTLDYIVQDVTADVDAGKEEISKALARRVVEVPLGIAVILKFHGGPEATVLLKRRAWDTMLLQSRLSAVSRFFF